MYVKNDKLLHLINGNDAGCSNTTNSDLRAIQITLSKPQKT